MEIDRTKPLDCCGLKPFKTWDYEGGDCISLALVCPVCREVEVSVMGYAAQYDGVAFWNNRLAMVRT